MDGGCSRDELVHIRETMDSCERVGRSVHNALAVQSARAGDANIHENRGG